jgi:hypothetical protein
MYLIFVSWGAAVLMPWNCVASCLDYMSIYVGTDAGGMDVFSIYPFANNFLVIFGMMFVIVTGNKYSYNLRICLGSIVSGCFLILIPLVVRIGGMAGFWSTFFVLCLFGFVCGVA